MKKIFLICSALSLFALSGCGFVADGPFGWVYTDSKTPVALGTAKTGTKEGKACVTALFGAFSVGDASIDAAMKTAGIKEIYTINKKNFSVFGTFTKQCTVVTGE